jgi:hypothetical protein
LEHPVINVQGIEILAEAHRQQLVRECAMAALAAQLHRPSRPGYRIQLARGLRAFASRLEPSRVGLRAGPRPTSC